MTKNTINRRTFIKNTSTVMVGTSLLLAGCSAGGKKNNGSGPDKPGPGQGTVGPLQMTPQDKALVFIMLDGGNDSFNMLIPASTAAYNQYKSTRSNLALNSNDLLPLNNFTDNKGRTFGLHPSMPEVQSLFNNQKLSFISNIAPMIKPVTKQEFQSGAAELPVGLLSHSDQFKHWQTAKPGERINRGWFGDFADNLQPNKDVNKISMNISLAGSNIMQNGVESKEYSINKNGSVGLIVNEKNTPLNNALLNSFENLLNTQYNSDFKNTYLDITRQAQAQHEVFKQATKNINVNTSFSDSDLSQQLKMVAKSIKAAPELGMKQQTFFVRYIGWDHHDELLSNHSRMLKVLSSALGEFQTSLAELGIEDKVITFTGSDFGRTLTSNGNGTDHGWGGNTLIMGKDINGGKVFGEYPSLALNSELDAGGGVLIPTTAVDELYAELALWFGVNKPGLNTLFPNLKHFYNTDNQQLPLGAVKV